MLYFYQFTAFLELIGVRAKTIFGTAREPFYQLQKRFIPTSKYSTTTNYLFYIKEPTGNVKPLKRVPDKIKICWGPHAFNSN